MSPTRSLDDPFAVHRTDRAPPFPEEHERQLLRLAALVAAAHTVPRPVSLILTDEQFMRDLNASYRGTNVPTDVLSFDLSTGGHEPGLAAGGEIYVCLERAAAQAVEQHVTLLEEVARLVAHGLLHLSGCDHDTSEALRAMEAETDRLLHAAGLVGTTAL